MRTIKTILTAVLLALGLLALMIALLWEQLLTPEQKLSYGLVYSAAEDYRARARNHADDPSFLGDYITALIQTGNLGRATYLAELYHVDDPDLAQLRDLIDRSLAAAEQGEVLAITKDPAAAPYQDTPLWEVLRFLEGYRHAVLGDWASALNHLGLVQPRKLPPALRPYLSYYLARAYRLAGSAKDREQVLPLLEGVAQQEDDLNLQAKARYNLVAWCLSPEYPGTGGLRRAEQEARTITWLGNTWAGQKAYTEFSQYYWNRLRDSAAPPAAEQQVELLGQAWENAALALLAAPTAPAGKAAGEQCLTILEWVVAEQGTPLAPDGQAWELKLPVPDGLFTAVAQAGVAHSFAARAAQTLRALTGHVADRDRWEELRAGLALCYWAERDASAMNSLMSEANLRGLGDATLAQIYFAQARLCESQSKWNEALNYYRSVGKLGGPQAGDAYYRCYAILKRVQEPLDLAQAENYLKLVTDNYPECESFPKAAEELLPILIYRGQVTGADKLLSLIAGLKIGAVADDPAKVKTFQQLQEVGRFWEAFLAGKAGGERAKLDILERIPLTYWNYYELCASQPPQPKLAPAAALLDNADNAGEYLAGLGLTDLSEEYFVGQTDPQNSLLMFFILRNMQPTKPVSSLQWRATEILESGAIQESALLDYVLHHAYPQPFAAEVQAAAKAADVEPALIYAVMKKESAFKADAVSNNGAVGLMQVMPDTARWLNSRYKLGLNLSNLDQPQVNIRLGTSFLRSLQDDLGGHNTRAVLTSYNRGVGNYRKWAERYSGAAPELLTELTPSEENEGFVKLVLKYYLVYSWLISQEAE